MKVKDTIINIRVPREFKQKIVEGIRNRQEYSITRVLMEGADYVLKRLAREDRGNKNGR